MILFCDRDIIILRYYINIYIERYYIEEMKITTDIT